MTKIADTQLMGIILFWHLENILSVRERVDGYLERAHKHTHIHLFSYLIHMHRHILIFATHSFRFSKVTLSFVEFF